MLALGIPFRRIPRGTTVWAPSDAKRIYIALDDHTDYMWTADEETYRQAFLEMIDYYLDLADATVGEVPEHQSRWNCDGSFWMWTHGKKQIHGGISAFHRARDE